MDPNRTDPYEKERFLSGVKTAAFVVILGAVALMADHTFFVAPQKAPAALGPAAAAPTGVQMEGFTVPDHLRGNASEVPPPPATF